MTAEHRQRKYPFEPIEKAIGGMTIAHWAQRLGVDPTLLGRERRAGLTVRKAEAYASALGVDPSSLWAEWEQAGQQGRPWSTRDDEVLRQLYRCAGPNEKLDLKHLAALLGRTTSALRARAVDLGLTAGRRHCGPPRTVPDQVCPRCAATFTPGQKGRIYCSKACADVRRWEGREHPRGMAGKRHTDETKARLKETSTAMMADPVVRAERVAAMHAGFDQYLAAGRPAEATHTRARGGRRADLDDRYFRSAWEANYARWLNYLTAIGQIAGWEYEPRTFEFPVSRGNRFYTPDFRVAFPDGRHEWHEVKGWMDDNSKVKLKRFAKHYPTEVLVLIDAPVYRSIAANAAALVDGWE